MRKQFSLPVIAVLATFVSSAAWAGDIKPLHGGFSGAIQSAATGLDVIKFTCGAQPAGVTYNQAVAAVIDKSTTSGGQKPILNVQTGTWTGTTCNWGAGAGTVQQDHGTGGSFTPDGDGTASPDSIVSITAGGSYCVKITKTAGLQNTATGSASAAVAESYDIETHCQDSSQPANHNGSTSSYLCDNKTPATCSHD